MPDRIIRDELWLSERFLDLPTDAARLAFLRFIGICDDFGNFEGGPRRLYRLLAQCTQIKSEEASAAVVDALMSCDLVRRYEVDTRELFHIPRFKSHRQYLSRAYPCSPWCNPQEVLGKNRKTTTIKGLAKDSLLSSSGTAEGVGVGVIFPAADAPEIDRSQDKPKAKDTAAAKELRRGIWSAYSDAYQDRYGVPPQPSAVFNAAIKRFSVQLPAAECVPVATFYVGHNNQFYVSKGHHLNHLAADAAKLRTEWATGRQITQTEAQQGDRRQGNRGVFQKIIKEIEDEKTND